MTAYEMYIGGRWIAGSKTIDVVNPASEETIGTTPVASDQEVAAAVNSAKQAQPAWGRRPAIERGALLRRWADLIDRDRERLATIITREEGKPLAEALGEVDLGNSWFRYYAEFDRRIEGDILSADQPNQQLWIVRQPIGVVSAIIPWNYPFAVAIRKVAPALIAGNSIVLKPHEDTPLAALELARLAEEAGIPPGVLNVVTGPGESVGEALVKNPIPRLITFTGSVKTGKRIARVAADNVTMVSLELGGKAPFIVMDDCDVDVAVETAVFSRFVNCGQVCICNERTYVHAAVAKEFTEKFLEKVGKLRVGDPLEAGTDIGPKVSRGELDKVESYVAQAKSEGAKVLTGGSRLTTGAYARGHWFEPTVLTNVRQEMEIMQCEVFGPVVPIMEFDDFDEAMRLANDSRYGLAAYLFTDNIHRVLRAVRDLECGELYINRGPGESVHGFHNGWKESGVGGDDGKYGLEHYLHKKTVYLKFNG
jgi:lactaldehyde dehydrogenase/glycolaldehyde dehydrogenase